MERNLKKERKEIRHGEGGNATVPNHKNQDKRCMESFPPPSSLLCEMGSEMWNGIRDVTSFYLGYRRSSVGHPSEEDLIRIHFCCHLRIG